MATIDKHPNGLRHVPVQDRGRERLEAILDAAAESFAEVGADLTTMEGVAKRSGSAIGSLYQFFPNKKVLFRTVVERSLERSQALFELLMPTEVSREKWPEMLDQIVDAYAAFEHTDPGFRAIWSNLHFHDDFEYDKNSLYDLLVGRTQQLISGLAPDLTEPRARVIAAVLVETINATIVITARKEPALAQQMLSETKIMLRRYVAPYLDRTTLSSGGAGSEP